MDNYEYEMPSDFEDEEIDEDEAFNDEDKRLYSEWFPPSDDDDVYEGEEKEEEEEEEGRKLLDSDEEADGDDSAGISEEEDSMMDGWDAMVDEEAEEEESVEEDGAHERMIAALKRGKAGPPRAAVVSEAYDENEYNLNPEATSLGCQPSQSTFLFKPLRASSAPPSQAPPDRSPQIPRSYTLECPPAPLLSPSRLPPLL